MKKQILFLMLIVISIGCYSQKGFIRIDGGILPDTEKGTGDISIPTLLWAKEKVSFVDWGYFVSADYKNFNSSQVYSMILGIQNMQSISLRSPIIGVTVVEAVRYCNWLSLKNKLQPVYRVEGAKDSFQMIYGDDYPVPTILADFDKDGFRLPTAQEWEYAAKGGSDGIKNGWWTRINPLSIGFFKENSNKHVQAQGSLGENPAGLSDVVGDAQEWCWDSDRDQTSKAFSFPVKGASYKTSVSENPTKLGNRIILLSTGKPDYFSSTLVCYGLLRSEIGIRLVRRYEPLSP